MPRNGKGGKRAGKPGAQYTNRSDLQQGPRSAGQPVRVASGQPYGQRGQQEASLRAMPLPTTPPAGARRAPPSVPQGPAGPPPGALTPLDAPTTRPEEPVTSGVPMGAGPGPEALSGFPVDEPLETLRGVFLEYPLDEIRDLIDLANEANGQVGALPGPQPQIAASSGQIPPQVPSPANPQAQPQTPSAPTPAAPPMGG